MLPGLHDAFGFCDAHANRFCQLLIAGFATGFLTNFFRLGFQHRDILEHVNRNTNGSSMIRNSTSNRLSNPPRRVG